MTEAQPKMSAHKALAAAVVAGLTSFIAAVQASPDLSSMGVADWLIIVASAVVAGGTVYMVPNQVVDTPGDSGDEPN